jgi:hypothetical protein
LALNQRAKIVTQIISILDHSTQRSLHPVLSPTVQSHLAELKLDGQVLVTGTRDLSYELWTFTKTYFHGLVTADVLMKVKWPILLFLVPHPPLDWALHHLLVFHELGHAQFRARRPAIKIPVPTSLQSIDSAPGQVDLLDRLRLRQKIMEYNKIIRNWIEEIYADLFGLLSAGPAFIFPFVRVLGGFFPLDIASYSHPPIALRLWLMLEAFRKRGFDSSNMPERARNTLIAWDAETTRIHNARAYRSSEKNPAEAEILEELVDGAVKIVPDIIAHIETTLGGRACTPSTFALDLDRSGYLFDLKIPPIEVDVPPVLDDPGTPMPAPRIFSVVWMAFYRAITDAPDADGASAVAKQLGSTLLESLDAAEALRMWRDHA